MKRLVVERALHGKFTLQGGMLNAEHFIVKLAECSSVQIFT